MNFDNLVAVLAVAAAVPLILAAVPRVPVPGPVLEIVAGILLGPAVLGLVKPDQAVRLVSPRRRGPVQRHHFSRRLGAVAPLVCQKPGPGPGAGARSLAPCD